MPAFDTLSFKFCPMCGERLSYTSYEAYCPYAGCHWNNEDADCTPPVDETAPVVVAHPVAVDGGECIQIDLRRVHVARPSWVCIRKDFWLDGIDPGWAGVGLDAPAFLPSGSAVVLGLEAGCPFIDGSVSRPGWYA